MNAQMETKLLSEDWCGVGSAQWKLQQGETECACLWTKIILHCYYLSTI